MRKMICFLLSIFTILNIVNVDILRINVSAESNTLEYATIKVITNNISEKIAEGAQTGVDIKTKNEKKTTLIKKDNKIFMSLDDICEFTRTKKENANNKCILKQGQQEITILIEANGNAKLKSLYGDFDIQTITENNIVYCEPEPLMSILFADCTYYDGALLIDLPQYTIYEAINFDYSKYHSDILSYGIDENDNMGTGLIKWGLSVQRMYVSLLSDIVVDANYGYFATDNTIRQYYYEAFNEVLGYDIYSNESVIEEETKTYEKINELGSFIEKTHGGDISDTPFTDFYISSYIDFYAKKGLKDDNSLSIINDKIRDLATNGRTNEKLSSYLNQSGKDVLTNILFNSFLEYVKRNSYDRKVLEMFKTLYSEDTVNKYNISLSENGQFLFQCARDYYTSCGSFDEIVKEVTLNESINKFSEMIIKGLFSVVTAGKSQEIFETYETVLTAEKLQELNSSFKPVEKINNSTKYFWLAKMQYTTALTYEKISNKANESLNTEDVRNLIANLDFYNRVSAVMIKTFADSYQLPTITEREKDLIANSDDYIGDLCKNIYQIEHCEYNLPTEKELNNKNCDVFKKFFANQEFESTENYDWHLDPTIPEEASTYNGHSYMVYPESMTWQEAKEYCEKLGGHLVTISDADEQKFIEELVKNCADKVSYWLGGYYSDAEWKWVDDTEFSYTNWDSWTDGTKEYRQPDNFYGDEFYLRLSNQDMKYENWQSNQGKWNDIANEADDTSGDVPLDSFGVICEWDYEQSDKSKDKIGEIIIEDGYLNVRDKPSTKGKVIGKLNNQDTVKIISEKDNWYEIEFDGKNGYVSSDYIKLIDNKSNNTSDEKGKEVDSGICGDNLTWSLDSNGLLTIEGKGKMYNYKYSPYDDGANRPPWQSKKIKSLVIKSGVTSIGNHAFNRQDNLSSISIADTVTSIGKEAFFSCDSLGYLFQIPENISSIAESAFGLCCNTRLLYVGKNVTNIEKYSLDSTYLLTIYGYNGTEAQIYAQNNNIPFVCVDDDYGYHGKVSNKNGASFKANAGDKAEEITVIPYDTEISEYDSIGDWALVKYNGKLGYVHKDDLHFEGGFAKPVIYLYPEKKQDISVKVKFKNGDFTCTYPEYNNGWNVTAYPDGRLINKSDNDEYSYLYWEGEGAIQYDFSSGFVVKSEDTAEFLKETLFYMGLTPKEYNEFIVYWLPIMQKNEYNLISFQTDNYEESAKLEISPKPDSMLRVFMAFKEVDENTVVPEQKLEIFKRNGFTVIEWGGTEVS